MIYFSYANFFDSLPLNVYSFNLDKTDFSNTNLTTDIADYTLLIYMIGSDFDSKKYPASEDIEEIKKVGQTSGINIVLQTGGGINEEKTKGIDFSKVQRHQIVNGTLKTLMDLGLKNMAEPNTLSDFIKWGILDFPAKKYAIIFWDHGSGIHGFGRDVNFNNNELTPSELQKGLFYGLNETGSNFELIGFDACLMSSLEVASRLNYFSAYMVASEEIVPEWGWNYTSIIKTLNSNPDQLGYFFGKSIVDSYSNSTRHLSNSESFGTHREVTLSLLDLTKVPQLVKEVNNLSKAIIPAISSLPSAINLSKSIDLTEHYGKSASGSTGLVDLYDLTTNIQETHPDLTPYIKRVQNSITSTIIYSYNGDARPNAKGISIYIPLLKNEYSNKAELQVVNIDWLTLLYTQRIMIGSDTFSPVIKSVREGNTIKGNVYGSDIANIFAEIITNSSDGQILKYTQNIEPSFIDSNGYFSYSDHKMLVLCNEKECLPTSMNLELNRDKRFVFIPIRLEADNGNINNNASLVFEIDRAGRFIFLGVNPEINPDETIPKGKTGLETKDKIFLESRPAEALFRQTGNITGKIFRESSEYTQAGPLLVNDPGKIMPHYVNISSPFTISFTICDYADNCDKTRWYKVNPSEQSTSMLAVDDPFGYDVQTNENNNSSNSINNFYTYINPTFGFKADYPSDWIRKSQNIYNIYEYDFTDPLVVEFVPSTYSESPGSGYYPRLSISVTDWPFKESPKSLFDYISNNKSLNYTMIESEPGIIAGSPAFKFIIEYISEEEQYLGVAKEKRKEMVVRVLMAGRMYDISFAAYASQFNNYLPKVEEIINSFGPYQIQNRIDSNMERISQRSLATTNGTSNVDESTLTNNQSIAETLKWSTYIDPKYGYSISYPSNVGIGKPFSMEDANPALAGNLFLLNNSSKQTPEPTEAVHVIVQTFHKNETDKIKKTLFGHSFTPISQNFDLKNLVSISTEQLSVYKVLPGFKLLENGTANINNNIVHIIEYSYFNPNFRGSMHEKRVYVTNSEDLTIFEYSANPMKYQQYLPVFEKMIESYKFQKKG
jgi:hypothetical protein